MVVGISDRASYVEFFEALFVSYIKYVFLFNAEKWSSKYVEIYVSELWRFFSSIDCLKQD